MSSKYYHSSRAKVPIKDQWDLSVMYKSAKEWDKDFQTIKKWLPGIKKFPGTLKSANKILECFLLVDKISRLLEKLYVYAYHKYSTDLSNNQANSETKRAEHLYNLFVQEIAFIQPELTKLPDAKIKTLIADKKFVDYKIDLKKIILKKKHILSDAEEKVLSKASLISSDPENIFSALDNVDLKFEKVKDAKGKLTSLTAGNYQHFLESKNRQVRQNAFEAMYKAYQGHIHTYAEILNSQLKQHHFFANVRKYKHTLEAALSRNQIKPSVYQNLIKAVHAGLPAFYKYVNYRKQQLKLKKMQMWDLRVDLIDAKPFQFTYDQAVELCLQALKPLGKDYVDTLEKGLKGGWVDKYENKGKRSGAFSGGCYDSHPYILMNFTGTLNDVYTLIHEAGHSMHSYLSKTNQSYNVAQYPIFTAEIASTVNERLLTDHLLKTLQGKQRLQVLLYEIDAIRATYFRQTMFAEYELLVHQRVEQGEPITPDYLSETYERLNQQYYGPDVDKDDYIRFEWARIPHFYYNYYVYQYATGIAAAFYFASEITGPKAEQARKNYLNFLSSGGNDFPLNQLKKAGLSFDNPQTFKAVVKNFEQCLNNLCKQPK